MNAKNTFAVAFFVVLAAQAACKTTKKNDSQLSAAPMDRVCTDYPGGAVVTFTGNIDLSTKAFTATYKEQGKGFSHGGEDARKLVADKNLWKAVPGDHYLDYRLDTGAWGCDISIDERESTPGRGFIFGSCESKTYQLCVGNAPPVADICNRGICEKQCTSPDSIIPIRPLPSTPDINNGNYVDCVFSCLEMKEEKQCLSGDSTGTPLHKGSNLDISVKTANEFARVPIFERGAFRAYADSRFTPRDISQLKEAMEIVYEQLGVLFVADPVKSPIGRCTQGTKGMKYDAFPMADLYSATFQSKNTHGFAGIWLDARKPFMTSVPGFPDIKYDLRILQIWDGATAGYAAQGDHAVVRPIIGVSWNLLKGYRWENNGYTPSRRNRYSAKWATVIAHEMLHTVGYAHPVGLRPDDPAYTNTFMVAFTDCIEELLVPANER